MRSVTRVLAAALGATILLPTGVGASSGFSDVPGGKWYETPVAWLVENDVTTGVEPGCFAPLDMVTRGQIATFIFRLDVALGGSPDGTAHPFVDVVADYQQIPVAWMYEAGITTGTSPSTYSPDDLVTRGQFAALLWRYAGRPKAADPHPFTDVTATWQHDAIAWMYEAGITVGTSSVAFSPDSPMSRAQAATFMWRFAGDPIVAPYAGEDIACSRDLRLALIDAGLTIVEAACAIDYLSDYSVEELTEVLIGTAFPPLDMIVAISAAANECLSPDRVDELTQLLF